MGSHSVTEFEVTDQVWCGTLTRTMYSNTVTLHDLNHGLKYRHVTLCSVGVGPYGHATPTRTMELNTVMLHNLNHGLKIP